MADVSKLTSCPHCGGDCFYVRVQMSGSGKSHRYFDGSSGQNDKLYDNFRYTPGKRAYCSDCDKYLGPAPQEEPDDNTAW